MRRFIRWGLAALVVLALGAALGSSFSPKSGPPSRAVDATASAAAATSPPTPAAAAKPKRHRRERATPTPAASAAGKALVSCDANIRARASSTTCAFAQNVFYEYYRGTGGYVAATTVRAWSPAVARFYAVRCSGTEAIVCRAGDGAEVRFSSVAVSAYSDAYADAYAATHDTGDASENGDTSADLGEEPSSDYPEEEPSYDDSEGLHDDEEADGGDGNEIPNYDNGTGDRVQCADGMYSHSGGRPGACSHHGGVG